MSIGAGFEIEVDDSMTAEVFLAANAGEFELQDTIEDTVGGGPPTQFFAGPQMFVLAREGFGLLRLGRAPSRIVGHVAKLGSRSSFAYDAGRLWLAIVYPLWGFPSLHASAASRNGQAVLLSGDSHAGKSTMALALGQRPGWTHVADDSVALQVAEGSVELLPIRSEVRLRPATQQQFGLRGASIWVSMPIGTTPTALCFLQPDEEASVPTLVALTAADAIRKTLGQVFLLSFSSPSATAAIADAVAEAVSSMAVYELRFRQSFDEYDEVLSLVSTLVR